MKNKYYLLLQEPTGFTTCIWLFAGFIEVRGNDTQNRVWVFLGLIVFIYAAEGLQILLATVITGYPIC